MTKDLSVLLEAKTAREFLKKALEVHYFRSGKVNISEFSRKAGFASRSFLTEYLSGKKNLSRESLAQLKKTLKLPRPYAQLFNLLVSLDQPELASKHSEDTASELESLKKNIVSNAAVIANIKNPEKILGKRVLFQIFAGLGSESSGADISDIITRTGLPLDTIREGLQTLLENNVINFREQRFYANSAQVDFLQVATPELSHLTKEVCSEIRAQTDAIVNSKNDFVFYTALSLQSQELPIFKEKLREAIYSVLDQFQNDTGDCVRQVFFCTKT